MMMMMNFGLDFKLLGRRIKIKLGFGEMKSTKDSGDGKRKEKENPVARLKLLLVSFFFLFCLKLANRIQHIDRIVPHLTYPQLYNPAHALETFTFTLDNEPPSFTFAVTLPPPL